MKQWYKFRFHITVIIIFIAYEVIFLMIFGAKPFALELGLHYFIELVVFYFNAHVVCPIWDQKQRWLMVAAIIGEILFLFVTRVGVTHWIADTFHLKNSMIPADTPEMFAGALYRAIFVIGFSIAYWIARRSIKQEKDIQALRVSELEHKNREMALKSAYLRSQVNPHVLYNTLALLSASLEGKSEREQKAIGLLTRIMEFALADPELDGKVFLSQEADQIACNIELYRLHNPHKSHIIYETDFREVEDRLRIPPLLLYSFAENIFKHADLSSPDNPARIKVSGHGNQVYMHITNRIVKKTYPRKGGVGTANAKQRLGDFYNGHYELNVNEAGDDFSLDLIILL